VLDPNLLAFVRNSIRSIWALEVLLLLRRKAPEALALDSIVTALRASHKLISRCLEQLGQAGLVSTEGGVSRFAPATPVLAALCDALEKASHERPIALRDAIASSPNDKLRNFSDAFRFKSPDKGSEGENE
jgi:predicted transcriptional regulator